MNAISLKVKPSPPVPRSLPAGRQGQSLVEAMAAVAVTFLVVTALVVLAIGAVRSATASRNQSQAVQYVQEGIEAVRSIRDRSFLALPPVGGPYQLVWTGTRWDWAGGEQTLSTIFKRSFTMSEETTGKLVVALSVSWIDSTGNHKIDLVTYLTDWR